MQGVTTLAEAIPYSLADGPERLRGGLSDEEYASLSSTSRISLVHASVPTHPPSTKMSRSFEFGNIYIPDAVVIDCNVRIPAEQKYPSL